MKPMVLANWKAAISPENAKQWLVDFLQGLPKRSEVDIVLAVPDLLLTHAAQELGNRTDVTLAAQDVSAYPPGSYTGSTPAFWLSDLVTYALVGHQERRRYFHETHRDVAAKVRECVDAGITPIVCLDEDQITDQLAAIEEEDERKSCFAYTPKDGIGFESKRTMETIAKVCSELSKRSGGRPVLYGGGVEQGNAIRLLELPEVSGILVAEASLDSSSFLDLIASVSPSR